MCIRDSSIYDAINAGFGKLVFVIRKDFEQDFREKIISKYEGHIPCELVFQSIDDLPEGFTCPADRTKPWGTNPVSYTHLSLICTNWDLCPSR